MSFIMMLLESHSTWEICLKNAGFDKEELREISEQIVREYEPSRKVSSIVFLPVDPFRVHIAWNIAPEDLRFARASLRASSHTPSPVLKLRIDHVYSGKLVSLQDFYLHESRGSIYKDLEKDDINVQARVGVAAGVSDFKSIVESEIIRMPRANRSPIRGNMQATLHGGLLIRTAIPPPPCSAFVSSLDIAQGSLKFIDRREPWKLQEEPRQRKMKKMLPVSGGGTGGFS